MHQLKNADLFQGVIPLNPKNKQFSYTSFTDGNIYPSTPDYSDELFLNGNTIAPYQLYNGSVGIFYINEFIAGVTNQVKFVRSVFEFDDLTESTNPLNFASVSSSNGFNITVGFITRQSFESVQHGVDGYFVTVNENIPFLVIAEQELN